MCENNKRKYVMIEDVKEKRKKVICDLVNDELYTPMKEKELAMFLQVKK